MESNPYTRRAARRQRIDDGLALLVGLLILLLVTMLSGSGTEYQAL